MDGRQCMIIDLEKRGDKQMFVTEQVSYISESQNGRYTVKFTNSNRIFNYSKARLLYLTHPEIVDIEEKGLFIGNRRINDVAELLRYTDSRYTFYRVTYSNGYYENLDGSEVYVTRTPIDRNDGSIWEYLRTLAAETSLTTDDEESILSRQYDLIDTKRDNVPLAQYLGDRTRLRSYSRPNRIYYPFGCNASQKAAVEAALTHQVSIIQGPPGTGKTQTILNIIANLLIKGKTVLVVSNNNSAIDNVAEKLKVEGLDFLLAKLGSSDNRKKFIDNQSSYPYLPAWQPENEASIKKQAKDSLAAVSEGFESQTRQALLKAEYDAVLKEATHYDMQGGNRPDNEWLEGKPSDRIMKLLSLYKTTMEGGHQPNLLFKLKWSLSLGSRIFSFLNGNFAEVTSCLESAYYASRKAEIEQESAAIVSKLASMDICRSVGDLRSSSLQFFKSRIAKRYAKRYKSGERTRFTLKDIKMRSDEFLNEYPVVLSTTYSARNCIGRDMVFDYVIMDEASQVDIKTGALALSCAVNAVIVGDDKQLPNVISAKEALALNAIKAAYNVEDKYDAVSHSFLKSCAEVFSDAPVTLLREHYRCHPKIIEFCNRLFYNGELVTMTTDNDEENVLQVVRTVKGNHARGHLNQREIDVIAQEVMPGIDKNGSVGIISPYRSQAEEINKALDRDIASTVHKYQGRECDSIIMTTVDNMPTEFSDDPNLLNVAISRAKTHLCIVTNGNEMPRDSILAQLIAYIQYNNFEVKESKLNSVFDLLYKQYTAERLQYETEHPGISEYLSENLIYDVLIKAIEELRMSNIAVLCHYPLSKLIGDRDMLDDEERAFAESPYSHVDFLVYNSLTKEAIQTIEVDGWSYHKDSSVQRHRDEVKDRILTKFGLCPHRLSTTDTVTVDTVKGVLQKGLQPTLPALHNQNCNDKD